MKATGRTEQMPVYLEDRSRIKGPFGFLAMLAKRTLHCAIFASFIGCLTATYCLSDTQKSQENLSDQPNCVDALMRPPFATFYGEDLLWLEKHDVGDGLAGYICNVDTLKAYFLERGWRFVEVRARTPGNGNSPNDKVNLILSFCLPRSVLLRWFMRCKGRTAFRIWDDMIVDHIYHHSELGF